MSGSKNDQFEGILEINTTTANCADRQRADALVTAGSCSAMHRPLNGFAGDCSWSCRYQYFAHGAAAQMTGEFVVLSSTALPTAPGVVNPAPGYCAGDSVVAGGTETCVRLSDN